MDPNACYERWKDLCEEGDMEEALHAAEDLLTWLNKGGFEPMWTALERATFFAWFGLRQEASCSTQNRLWTAWVRALSSAPPQMEKARQIASDLQGIRDRGVEPTNWTPEGRAEFEAFFRNIDLREAPERWYVDERDWDCRADLLVKNAGGLVVTSLPKGTDDEGGEAQLKTARLIAIAPEMRDLLKQIWEAWEGLGGTDPDAECNGGDALDALSDIATAAREILKSF